MELIVGLEGWAIVEGSYGDFLVGGTYTFALEFGASNLKRANPGLSINASDGRHYSLNAKIVCMKEYVWIIDFGICAMSSLPFPKEFRVGDYVSGDFSIGVDPFAAVPERGLFRRPPRLTYKWNIKGIRRNEAPFYVTADRRIEREQASYKDVLRTNYEEDGPIAEYLLQCEYLES